MPDYLCPVCQELLVVNQANSAYSCARQHHFDRAKAGYLNLLPVQHKHSKDPGDHPTMLQARQQFLAAGYYQPLAEAIAQLLDSQIPDGTASRLLDLGCGEGYYSRQLASRTGSHRTIEFHGVDIAKFAIASAAKQHRNGHFVVASTQRLPYPNAYFDILLRVFAPSNATEMLRVLKPDGLMLLVTPGPRHLWQLKEFIYAEVKEHALEAELPEQCHVVSQQRCQYRITPTSEHRMTLLQMTPFAWRANLEAQARIAAAEQLEIETDFVLTLASCNSYCSIE